MDKKAIFKECRGVWMDAYRAYTGVGYYFSAKDAGALAGVIRRIAATLGDAEEPDGDAIVATFRALLEHLPAWYRENAYSLTVVNGKYNEIIAEIRKKQKHGKNGLSEDFRAAILGG